MIQKYNIQRSEVLSDITSRYCDMLIMNLPNEELNSAKIIEAGVIIDDRINKFQNR